MRQNADNRIGRRACQSLATICAAAILMFAGSAFGVERSKSFGTVTGGLGFIQVDGAQDKSKGATIGVGLLRALGTGTYGGLQVDGCLPFSRGAGAPLVVTTASLGIHAAKPISHNFLMLVIGIGAGLVPDGRSSTNSIRPVARAAFQLISLEDNFRDGAVFEVGMVRSLAKRDGEGMIMPFLRLGFSL